MPTDTVKSYEEGLQEPSGLKWSRSYIAWKEFTAAADELIAQYRARALKVVEDRTRTAEWRMVQTDALQDEYRAKFGELVTSWESRFTAWEAEARKQGQVKPRSAAAEAAYQRALVEVGMIVPNASPGELRDQLEAAVLRDTDGEIDGWVSALTALVKPEPFTLTGGGSSAEEVRRQNTTALLRRVAEVAEQRTPSNVTQARENLAWLEMNRAAVAKEREFLAANRMDLAPEVPTSERARMQAWIAEMSRPV